MTPERSLRGHLIAMLIGAALLVLGQPGSWPPETWFERALTGLTVAAVLIAVSLTANEWRQSRRRRGRDNQPRPRNGHGPSVRDGLTC